MRPSRACTTARSKARRIRTGAFRIPATEAAAAAATFEELGDHLGALRAWNWVGLFDFWNNRCADAEVAYERMVEHARLASNEREASRVPWWVVAAAAVGPRPVTDAEQRCRELTALGHDDPYIEALGSIVARRPRRDARKL